MSSAAVQAAQDQLSVAQYVSLEIGKALAPVLIAMISGLFVWFRYRQDQKTARKQEIIQTEKDREQEIIQAEKNNTTRRIEAQKPFASIQLQLFMEAGKVAGQLATFDKTNDTWMQTLEWKNYYTRFYQLYYTELSIVENQEIKEAMQSFSKQLKKVLGDPQNEDEGEDLKQASYQLAKRIRKGIEETWEVKLDPLTGTK